MKQFLILGIVLVVATFVVILCNPTQKEVRILSTTYKIQQQETTPVDTKVANVSNQNIAKNQTVKMNNVEQSIVKQTVNVNNTAQSTVQKAQTVKNVNTTKNVPVKTTNVKQSTVQKTTVTPTAQKPVTKTVSTKQTTIVQPAKPVVQQPKSAPAKTAEQVQKEKAAQEAISWNKWRANVHNMIIQKVNLPNVPEGTKFTYSFTVTKDGTISNIKTMSTEPRYTAFGIQYIKPAVVSSAHQPFLKFPAGSERTVVDVKYTFTVNNQGSGTRASAASFSDVEVIKK